MESEITQYIDATLALHGMELDEARRAEVEKQFLLLGNMYLSIAGEPLPMEIESANIYRL